MEDHLANIDRLLESHITKDDERFDCLSTKMDKMLAHTNNLSDINDFIKGIGLMKKPMIWLVAFVVGIVALLGGVKTLLGYLGISVMKN